MGDTESRGFLHHCFQVKHGCHYFCCLYLETLSKLTSRACNPNSDKYLKILSCLPLTKLKQIGLGHHADTVGLKKCIQFIFEFVCQLEQMNPKTNYQSLFTSQKSKSTYEGWKARNQVHQVSNPGEIFLNATDSGPEMSAAGVFGQPLCLDDLEEKQVKFVAATEKILRTEDTSTQEILTQCDISNFDMAILRSVIPISGELPYLSSNRVNQLAGVYRTAIDSEIRERSKPSKQNHLEVPAAKTGSEKSEAVILQLYTDGVVEIKLAHRNMNFNLKLKTSSAGARSRWRRPGVVSAFHFESADDMNTSSNQFISRIIEVEEEGQRKGSQDSSACDFGGSNSSTTAGSESSLPQQSTEEVICQVSGELAFEVESSKTGLAKGSNVLIVHLFLAAKDRASTAILKALPDIKHLVNTAVLETFQMLATS